MLPLRSYELSYLIYFWYLYDLYNVYYVQMYIHTIYSLMHCQFGTILDVSIFIQLYCEIVWNCYEIYHPAI